MVSSAREIVFLITGEDKADAVRRVFRGPPDPQAPGSLVEGDAVALLDPAAAARL
jgi:6-phosphogluconolactonase/glucosamine-6-phosphate isomerase/deaminase